MAEKQKKKSRTIGFVVVFALIVTAMVVVNYKSGSVQEFYGPDSGIADLYTVDNNLAALSQEGEIYLWPWDDLAGWPKISEVKAVKTAYMSGDRLLIAPKKEGGTLVLRKFGSDKETTRKSIGFGWECEKIVASDSGKYAAALFKDKFDNRVEAVVVNNELREFSRVFNRVVKEPADISDITVSSAGTLAALAGRKSTAWILVVGTKSKKVLWEKEVGEAKGFARVAFNPDGSRVYAATTDRFVYVFEGNTGDILEKLEIAEYQTAANNPQSISCIRVSSDGRFLAASTVPASRVWLWDAQTSKKLAVIRPDQYTVNSLAFSPDSSLLATGDLIGRVPMKVWRLSDAF